MPAPLVKRPWPEWTALAAIAGTLIVLALRAAPPPLGPADGHDLHGEDLDRVQVGDFAPDFTLRSYEGNFVTLSSFRGRQNVVLVFYRGHW